MQENLYKQIIDKLRTDVGAGSLVVLTGHTAGSLRIARDEPPVKDRTPFLGVRIGPSIPLIGVDVTRLQRTRVYFRCYSRDELAGIRLADRMDLLLHADAVEQSNLAFYDFTGGSITNQMTRWKSRTEAGVDDLTEVWTITVEAELIWFKSA